MAEVLGPQEPRPDGMRRRRFFIARPVADSPDLLDVEAMLQAVEHFGPDTELELLGEHVAVPVDEPGGGWTGRYIVFELVPAHVTQEVR